MKVGLKARQRIFDGMRLEHVSWSGALDDVEFLSRIFDLASLPSHDHRFGDAAGDIWQHRVNNDDWDEDWVFSDRRFNLAGCPAQTFLDFLCQTIHPVVRPHREEALALAAKLNEILRPEGVELAEEASIFGRPEFVARPLRNTTTYLDHAKAAADVLDAGWMAREVLRIERAIDQDPDDALRGAKDLVESCCKSILAKRGVEVSRTADMPKIVKATLAELKLTREDISDTAPAAENIRHILGALSTISGNLAELRNAYGTGHGRAGNHQGLDPRHARLAVMAAVSFVTFVTDTHRVRGPRQGSENA